ncbi:MAG: hypothetical protein ACREGA_02040 [Candidatus Saccharimonadales bacterium]
MERAQWPTIINYEVIKPPTSGQVRELVLGALGVSDSQAELDIKPEATPFSPDPETETIQFRIDAMRKSTDGSATFIGSNQDTESVNLSIASNPQTPARLSMVRG